MLMFCLHYIIFLFLNLQLNNYPSITIILLGQVRNNEASLRSYVGATYKSVSSTNARNQDLHCSTTQFDETCYMPHDQGPSPSK